MLTPYSTADEIQYSGADTAVLPIGSTEQHGPHLPIATDYIIAGVIGEKVADSLGAVLLPVLPVSTCREHMGKKGSVWMNPDTFYFMVRDIVMSLKEQGFKRVVILQSHGAIFILTPAIRELNATVPDIDVIRIDITQFYAITEMNEITGCSDNLHACGVETSLLLYLKEELVRRDKIVDCVPDVSRDYLNYGSIFKVCPDGVWGKPSLSSAEKGKRILELLVEKSVAYAEGVMQFLQNAR